ncbi:branched-chain amino acid ABC transporter permease [Streptomyces sp. NPDC057636]|uniref:branched-chain amino acid ABC transporter permease n=1 Tax=Streptomyces sp. NPDC057636 TaxID=3346189 RepID=UPI0036B3B3D0
MWYDANVVLLQSTLVNLLLALSLQIPLRSGVFSFVGIGSYGVGAYTTAIGIARYGHGALPAIAEGMLAAGAVGLALALLLQRLSGLYMAMASIAYVGILTVLAQNGGTLTGGAEGLYGVVADLGMTEIVGIVVIVVALAALSERGRLKRRIEAVRDDPELASAMGINVRRVRFASTVAASMVGALAGGINAVLLTSVSPADFGFHLSILALTMIVVGGAQSWLGALVGAVIFTWLPIALQSVGDGKTIVYGALVTVVAVVAPTGLVGLGIATQRSLRSRLRNGATAPPSPAREVPPASVESGRL